VLDLYVGVVGGGCESADELLWVGDDSARWRNWIR